MVDLGALGEVLIATRLVIGSAVKRVPSTVEETGAAIVTRMLFSVSSLEVHEKCERRADRAPIAPLSAASREIVFATGCVGVLFGSATGVLFPTFWRFVSDAILMQDPPMKKKSKAPFAVSRLAGTRWKCRSDCQSVVKEFNLARPQHVQQK